MVGILGRVKISQYLGPYLGPHGANVNILDVTKHTCILFQTHSNGHSCANEQGGGGWCTPRKGLYILWAPGSDNCQHLSGYTCAPPLLFVHSSVCTLLSHTRRTGNLCIRLLFPRDTAHICIPCATNLTNLLYCTIAPDLWPELHWGHRTVAARTASTLCAD